MENYWNEEVGPVKAVQWMGHGDEEPRVESISQASSIGQRFYCSLCKESIHRHGRVVGSETIVCPADWLLEYPDEHIGVIDAEVFAHSFETVPAKLAELIIQLKGAGDALGACQCET